MLTTRLTNKTFCSNLKLSDVITFGEDTNITEYEMLLCNLDINVLLHELVDVPVLKECIKAVCMFVNIHYRDNLLEITSPFCIKRLGS